MKTKFDWHAKTLTVAPEQVWRTEYYHLHELKRHHLPNWYPDGDLFDDVRHYWDRYQTRILYLRYWTGEYDEEKKATYTSPWGAIEGCVEWKELLDLIDADVLDTKHPIMVNFEENAKDYMVDMLVWKLIRMGVITIDQRCEELEMVYDW